MRTAQLLTISGILEMVTGIGLVAFPDTIGTLLFSQGLSGAGLAVGRVTGFALLALGWAFWEARLSKDARSPTTSLFGYNILVAVYLTSIGADNLLTGVLLWPAVAVHGAIGISCLYIWLRRRMPTE